jgi:hypothetical protein
VGEPFSTSIRDMVGWIGRLWILYGAIGRWEGGTRSEQEWGDVEAIANNVLSGGLEGVLMGYGVGCEKICVVGSSNS